MTCEEPTPITRSHGTGNKPTYPVAKHGSYVVEDDRGGWASHGGVCAPAGMALGGQYGSP